MALRDHNKWRIAKRVLSQKEERFYVYRKPFYSPFWLYENWHTRLEEAEDYVKRAVRVSKSIIVYEATETIIAMADKLNGQR